MYMWREYVSSLLFTCRKCVYLRAVFAFPNAIQTNKQNAYAVLLRYFLLFFLFSRVC